MAEAAPESLSAARARLGRWLMLLAALRHPKTGFILLFGFASGLPYALLLGTLYAWLTDARVDVETMGVFSLIGLAYAFKFLWSPALDRVDLPLLRRLGKRKQWIVSAQVLLGTILVTLSALDPLTSLGLFSLLAGIGAFASATQDVVIDAWRVDVADEVATIDILSTVFQMGYRIAALVGGALALFMAEREGWPNVSRWVSWACSRPMPSAARRCAQASGPILAPCARPGRSRRASAPWHSGRWACCGPGRW
jgi:PAT family beta-lactamase induction signal transducer AmpG